MAEKKNAAGERGETRTLRLAGKLIGRQGGVIQIDLVDGMTVSVMEDDCKVAQETTDPVTKRAMVMLEITGNKPISATFQPHLFQVLAHSGAVPFAFAGAAEQAPDQFDMTGSIERTFGPEDVGGFGGGIHGYQETLGECASRSQSWTGGWSNDDRKLDRKDDSIF